ncbi:hypothetical protein N0V90_009597 [Kalmusia sp. IMI 367209]|nr:hypothetical protein N0V90_009597 [Kalmusia sp. IMI 367209]
MSTAKGTILVTGANGGLGSAIVKHIVSKPELAAYHGLYTVRDATAAPALSSTLSCGKSHPHDVLSMELTKLDSVRQTAKTINARVSAGEIPPIRALILNAGFQDFGKQSWTDDGLDTTFAANYLGHWLLTLLLLESMDRESGRIVLVGSQSHDCLEVDELTRRLRNASPYDKRNESGKAFVDEKYKTIVHDEASFEAIAKGSWSPAQEDPSFRSGFRRYGAAKLFLIMMVHDLQRRMNQDPALKDVCILGVDPGTMITGLQRYASWFIRIVLFRIVFPIIAWLKPDGPVRTTEKSAAHVLQAAFDSGPILGQYPKDLYFDGTEPLQTSAESQDARKRDMVWRESVRYAQLKQNETILATWS